jgi:Ti-type conjugative transfer relaxase TraA
MNALGDPSPRAENAKRSRERQNGAPKSEPSDKQQGKAETRGGRQRPARTAKRHRTGTDRSPAAVLAALTRNRATFTKGDIQREAAPDIIEAVIQHPDVIHLPDEGTGKLRYTTRQVLEAEQEVLSAAGMLARQQRHDVAPSVLASILARDHYRTITPEQRRAFRHATAAAGLALIDGQAGTGKSFVLGAVRQAYEAEGYRVIGLAPTNAVAEQLRQDGFNPARTLHSELYSLDKGFTRWTARTVVMVDEAAMIGTELMQKLTAHAQRAGAKLILTGDDRQLSSIERGGMFAVLKERFGAAPLSEVKRQKRSDDRRASELMAEGNFHDALASYDRKGGIHWTDSEDEARDDLVTQWAKDTAAIPDQSRFVFAYTNRDVDQLNEALRQVRQQRGELGAAYHFTTKHGEADFSRGDRVQFTGTDKAKGLFNGEAGTVREIEDHSITVAIDGPGSRVVSFDPDSFKDLRHGYAGTIYKGQGRTLDQTYLFHSLHWRASSSYVALTRHRDTTQIFVSRETAPDLDELTRQVSRVEDRRAASHFLKGQFREAMRQATTKEEPAPEPETRRRKGREDTGRAFRMSAKKTTRRTGRAWFRRAGKILRRAIPFSAAHEVEFTSWETPPDYDEHAEYLRFLEMSEQEDFNPQHENGGFHYAEAEHLSPHL